MVTHFPEDGHQPSPGWSPTIPRMVNYHPQDGHPPLKGMVTHHPQGGHPPTVKWWITIPGMVVTVPRTVTHHFQDGQLDLEIDSRAAQLVSFNVVQCPHPNCSPHQQSMWGVPPPPSISFHPSQLFPPSREYVLCPPALHNVVQCLCHTRLGLGF